jgi:hypothetical protein
MHLLSLAKEHVAETLYRDSSGLPVRNRSPGGWGGEGRESHARPLFPILMRYKRDGVRIRVHKGLLLSLLIQEQTFTDFVKF